MHHPQTELGTSAAPRSVGDGAKVITWAYTSSKVCRCTLEILLPYDIAIHTGSGVHLGAV